MYQPDLSVERMHDLGITPSTASMKPRDEYKNIQAVLDNPAFKDDDGKFDEKKFNSFYDSALLLYNQTAELDYLGKLESSYEYDPWAWYAADKPKRNTAPVGIINPNPWRLEYGIDGIGKISPGKFSAREIGQDQYYFDSEKGEFSDKKPNDFVGIFNSFKAPRLVLDTYDKDTIELVNGKEVLHEKGSFKLNEYGAPYYRTLRDDEEVYDKDLLHVTDIWSIDGVGINKYDPFDSDGLTTEPWKVVVKNVLRVAPFLIGGEVGLVIKGLSAAAALFEFMPTFLKAIDGIATGNAMDDDFGRKMNQLETWLGRLDFSVSDRSREKLVTFENIGNMFADVTAQLFQQKAIASLPQSKVFKNVDWMRNNARVGRALSYAYMSATSSKEAYSIFKNAGANDATSGIAMLALMGVYYKLMSSDYFKDVLFKGTWLDESNYKRITWGVLQDFKDATMKNEVPKVTSPENAKKAFSWFQRAWTKAIGTIPVEGKGFVMGALSEGVEETMEEVGIDALKGLAAGMNALGIPVTREDTELDFGYSWDDVKTRYLTSFFGGAFGGAVFHGYNLIDPVYRNGIKTARQLAETPDGRVAELVNLAINGRAKDVKRYATKLAEKGLIGSDSLSGTLFELIDSVDGKTEVSASSEGNVSQNELVYDAFMKQVNFIENILSDEGFLKARDEIVKSLKFDKDSASMRLFESLGISDLIMYDVRRLGTQITKVRAKMQDIADSLRPSDENYDKTEYEKKVKNNESYKQAEAQLKELRKQFDDLLKVKDISRYVVPAVLARNKAIRSALMGYSDIDEYVQAKHYGKHFDDFTPEQQQILKDEYEAYIGGEKKHLFELGEVYRVLSELMTKDILELDKKYGELEDDKSVETTTYGNEYINLILQKSKLYAALAKINSKEELTDEDLENKAKLQSNIDELNTRIADFKANSYLATSLMETEPITWESITEGATNLLEYYKSFIGKFKYSDDELNEFFHKIREHYLALNVRAITEEWLLSKEVDDDNPDSFYRQTAETEVRKDFYNLLSRFYSQIWVDNDAAKKTYDAIVDLLANRVGMSEEDIHNLLHNQIATGKTSSVTGPDGVTTLIRLTDSLIPQIGDNQSILDYIDDLNAVRSQIIYSDIFDILNKFSVATEDGELIDIMKAIQEEELKIVGNLDNYRIGDPLIESKLSKAQLFLKTVYAAIAGAGNGANKIINLYREKESKEPLAKISDKTRQKILKQLTMLDNRIGFIKDLHALNSGQKMRQQQETGVNMRLKFLKNFKETVYIEEIKNAFGESVAENIEKIFEAIDLDNITVENFDQNEVKIIEVETKLYDEIQSLKLSEDALAAKIVQVFGKNSAWRQRSTKFTADRKGGVTDYDQIVYAAAVFSLNSNAFFYKEKSILEELKNLGDIQIVPVFPQEHALRIIYAFIHNKALFNNIIKQVGASYKGTDNYVINKILLNNMISVFGGAGTGKTEGVGFFLSKLFDDVDFIFVGPTENQVKKLIRVFNAKSEQGKTFKEFFEAVAPQYLKSDNFKYDDKKTTVTVKDPSLTFKDWWKTDNNKVRILLIDEAGLANSHQLDVFSRYAEHFGAFAVTLGDTKQNTGTITYVKKEVKDEKGNVTSVTMATDPDGFEDTFGIRTPPLKATFRAENRAKADNYAKLDHRLEVIDDKIQSSEKPIESDKRDSLVEKIDTALDYNIFDDHIAGDYITKDEVEFKELLDRLIEKGETSILLITDSTTAKKYQDPKYDGKVTKQDAYNAQGGEFRYVFVDKAISESKYDNLKDLYTTSQRATLASIVLDSKNVYDDTLGIKSVPRRDADMPYVIPDDERKHFIEWRLKSLEKVQKPDNYEELIKITPNITVVSSTTTPKKSEQKSGSTPEPELEPEPTPAAEPEPEPEPEPEIKPKPAPIIDPNPEVKAEPEESPIKKVIPLVDNSAKEKPVFVEKTPVEYTEEDDYEESPNQVSTWAASEKFFNLIFGKDFGRFFSDETSNPNSFWSLVNNNGVKLFANEYQDIMLVLHRAVMNNIPINQAILNARLKMSPEKVLNFKRIFMNDNFVYSLWNVRSGEDSNIMLVITHKTDTSLQHSIVIGTLMGNILPSGRFADGVRFKILTKPKYTKNDKEWVEIGVLKKRFPWLTIPTHGGIPINSDVKQKSSAYNERTKKFLRDGDGKSFGFGYDVAYVDEDQLLVTDTLEDGTLYLHRQSDVVTTFGIQKKVSPREIMAYSACIYYLSNKGHSVHETKGESLLNALIELGVVTRGSKSPLDEICKYLYETTKNIGWSELVGLFGETTKDGRNAYYEKLRKCCIESPIVTGGIASKIATDVLSAILNQDSELNGISITQLFYEFTKKEYTDKSDSSKKSRRAVIILKGMDRSYMIKSRQDGSSWKLELYECQPNDNSYNIVGSSIVSYDLKASTFQTVLKQIVTKFGEEIGGMPLTSFNSYNVDMEVRTERISNGVVEGYSSQNPASMLYTLFGYSFINNSGYEKALNPSRFKYGINGAIVKSDVAVGDQMAPFVITDDMVTNASHWTPSTYSFVGEIIPGELQDPNTANRTILYNQANEWIDEIRYNVEDMILEFNDLVSNLMSTLKNDVELNDDSLEMYFNDFLNSINRRLLENTFELRVTQFRLEDSAIIKEELGDNMVKAYAYTNIINTFEGIDPESENNIVFSRGGIDVVQNSGRFFVISQSADGVLQAKETKTFDAWQNAWSYVASLGGTGLSTSALTYLFNMLTDTVTTEQVDAYMNSTDPRSEDIARYINNYLEQRLLNEEC